MRSYPRAHVRDFHDVVTPVPLSEKDFQILGFVSSGIGGGSGSFILGPGFQAIEGGQVPQALPGQQAAPSNSQTPAASPLPVSATPQNAAAASSPLPPAAPSSSQLADPSIPPVSALPSGSSSAQVSILPFHFRIYHINNSTTDISRRLRKPGHHLACHKCSSQSIVYLPFVRGHALPIFST